MPETKTKRSGSPYGVYRRRRSVRAVSGGFTLMEIMVAIAVIGMIMGLIWGTYANTISSKDYVEAGNEMYHQMRWALEKMSYDLSCAYISKGKNNKSQFVAISHDGPDGVPQDELHFTSFSHIRYNPNEKSSDQCEVSYMVVQNPEDETFILFRREDFTLDDDLFTGGEVDELVEGIVAFQLRYFDGEEWVEQWDSRNFAESGETVVETVVEQSEAMVDSIPVAVEIAMSMRDQNGQEVFLTTKVKLVLSSIDLKMTDEGMGDDDTGKGKEGTGSGAGTGTGGAGGTKPTGPGQQQQTPEQGGGGYLGIG